MARSKANRAAKPGDATASHKNPNCKCHSCLEMRSATSKTFGHRSYQDVQDAIDYHWKTLSEEVKVFLMENPSEMNLRKLLDFWTSPHQIECTGGKIAASMCGSSWYLALNYICIGKLMEAKALILNGAFLHQCCVSLMKYA